MSVDQLTIDKAIDVSKNSPPEFGFEHFPIFRSGSVTTSNYLGGFVPQFNIVPVGLQAFPSVIASGTLKVDVYVDGVLFTTTPATATMALEPSDTAVFPGSAIDEGAIVTFKTASDSSTVTDCMGVFIFRPQFGSERQ